MHAAVGSLLLCPLLACTGQPEPAVAELPPAVAPAGQVPGLGSPRSSKFAEVPIVAVPDREFASWWMPRIVTAEGDDVFVDQQGFPARFNIYWDWDQQDRFWIYNTDDGAVWVYRRAAEGWGRTCWEQGLDFEPPASIQERLDRGP